MLFRRRLSSQNERELLPFKSTYKTFASGMAAVAPTDVRVRSRLTCVSRFASLWDRYQVELHGRCSAQKVERMREYALHTSRLRLLLLGLLTPVPVLIIIILVDCIPLVSPDEGTNQNYAFWLRMAIVTAIFVAGLVNHFRCYLPELPLSDWELFLVAAVTTIAGSGFAYLVSRYVGFPVPFTLLVQSIPGLPTVVIMLVYLWRRILRGNAALQRDLHQQSLANLGQFIKIWIHPLYLFVFSCMTARHRSAFILVLPMIKVTLKNFFSRTLRDL